MDNSLITILLVILSLLLVGLFVFIIKRFPKQQEEKKENIDSIMLLQQQIQEMGRQIDTKLSESNTGMRHQFGESEKIIRDVTERLVKLDETNKQVVGFAEQLQSLQDVLKNPKQRGILGEYYLETLLKNVLPPGQFQMQYPFKNGEIVDAVVFVQDKIIPIDSKFSLENYNKVAEAKTSAEREEYERLFKSDLKKRIDETAKYVRPGEGTMDFAFMFIPHEAIYYDLLVAEIGAVKVNTRDLIEYAFKEKHVIIVSPTSFLAYLQTVLQGLRALKIEESAKEIRKNVEALSKHLNSYEEFFTKVGGHLTTTMNAYNFATKEFTKIDKDITKIKGVEIEDSSLLHE